MGAFVVAIALCLLVSSVSRAVPIIGGEITQTLTSTHVQLVGPWFDIGFGAGVPALGSYSAYLDCESGCREGDVVDLLGNDGGDNLTFATGGVRGVFYPALNLGRDDIQTAYNTFFNISAGAITVDGSLVYQRPFTFSGRLVAFTPGAVCVICAPGTEDLPLLVDKTIPIEGRGILTMNFHPPVIFEGESFYSVNTMDWEFAAIPEPGTGALVAGSILLLWLRRCRRSTSPMSQSRPSSFEAPVS